MDTKRKIPLSRAVLCVILAVIFTALTVFQFIYYGLFRRYREDLAATARDLEQEYLDQIDFARRNEAVWQARATRLAERLSAVTGEYVDPWEVDSTDTTAGDGDAAACLANLLRLSLTEQAGRDGRGTPEDDIRAAVEAYMAANAGDALRAAEKLLFVDYLYRTHYDGEKLSSAAAEEAMLEAYLAAAGDVYASYYTKDEYDAFIASQQGGVAGIGAVCEPSEDGAALRILYVHTDSPNRGVLLDGDRIIAVNGVSVRDSGTDAAKAAIPGEAGTSLPVVVERGGASLSLVLRRAAVQTDSVLYRTIRTAGGKTVGYVRLLRFHGRTAEEFRAACAALREAGVDTFLFDLRDNPGGNLSAVSDVLSYLLPSGAEICSFDYYDGTERAAITAGDGEKLHGTFYVLQNARTTSAAELFCAALRDNGRATTVGTTTYGKGCMQSGYRLADGACVMITVALYTPPSGENYSGRGVDPDERVTLSPAEAAKTVWDLTDAADTILTRALELADTQ